MPEINYLGNYLGHGTTFEGTVYDPIGIAPTILSRDYKGPKAVIEVTKMSDIKIIGQMDNTQDHTFESANRVYDSNGICPTIPTICGGGHEPKILEIKELGFIEKGTGKHQSNIVYSKYGLCPTIPAGMGVKQQPTMHVEIVAMRGRDPENPSDRTPGNPNLEQRLEPNSEGICNTLTSVQKDNLVLESQKAVNTLSDWIWEIDGEQYLIRIRKLTPKECWSLMDFNDGSFEKAQEVNSNTQLYKQAGNSIVVNCLVALFGQLIEGKEDFYRNEKTNM